MAKIIPIAEYIMYELVIDSGVGVGVTVGSGGESTMK
jgi:hypothetical protein